MNNEDYIEYFIDGTFKLIPKKYKPFKILTIATIDYKNNKSLLIGFIHYKYMDYITYLNIFKYLNEINSFNPRIIHSDFEFSIFLNLK